MSIEVASITSKQKHHILSLLEDHFTDLKAIEIAPAKLTKALSAFANSEGGELYIGIDEDKITRTRTWRGFVDQEAANGHLQIFEKLFPLGSSYSYTFLACSDSPGLVLKVEIQKTREIKVASDDRIYIRRGAQNLPVITKDEIKRLELNKGVISFESETIDVELSEITNSIPIIQFLLEVIPTPPEPRVWLSKQRLIHDGKPTVAGILLFSEEPQATLPKRCAIKIFRYKTSDKEGSRDTLAFDPITIEGNLYDQIVNAVQKTIEIIETSPALGTSGLENITYPQEALHEIITNAVLHRDYSFPTDVQVRIFDNRIEVESPGTLAGHITVKNILQEQFARNPFIVRLIHKFPNPPNKDVGEGLNTAFQAMRRLNLKDPLVEENENSVVVYIRHEPLASREVIIMDYLETHTEINNSKARELCYVGSENSMKNTLKAMVKSGLIQPIPGRQGKAYAYKKRDV